MQVFIASMLIEHLYIRGIKVRKGGPAGGVWPTGKGSLQGKGLIQRAAATSQVPVAAGKGLQGQGKGFLLATSGDSRWPGISRWVHASRHHRFWLPEMNNNCKRIPDVR